MTACGRLCVVENLIWGPLFVAVRDRSSTLEANMKQIIAELFEVAWSDGDFSRFDQVWHESVTFHFRGSSSNVSIEGLQDVITFWTGFPDFTFTVHQIIAEIASVLPVFTLANLVIWNRVPWWGNLPP